MVTVSILMMLVGQTWARAYDRIPESNPFNDSAYSVVYDDSDNTYAFVGHTETGPLGLLDVMVTKVDASTGKTIWTMVYGNPPESNDYGRDIILDKTIDGHLCYVITGYTESFTGFGTDVLIFKILAADGSLLWGFRYCGFGPDPLDDYAYSITKDGGDYLIAGNVEPGPTGGLSDALVMSVACTTGVPNWAWAYGKMVYGTLPTDDYLYSIIEDRTITSDSLYVVAGKSYNEIELPISDILVFKGKKSDGSIDPATWWLHDYMVPPCWHCCAYDIKNDHTAGYILTGDADSNAVVMKLNPNLTVGWGGQCRTYCIPSFARSRCIEPTSDGNYVFTGFTSPGLPGPVDLLLTKINPSGGTMWSKVLAGCPATPMGLPDFGQYVIEQPAGFYATVGYTNWPAPWGTTNSLLARTDANGIILCPQSADTCMHDIRTSVDTPTVLVDTSVCEYPLEMIMEPIVMAPVESQDSLICGQLIGIDADTRTHNMFDAYNSPNPYRAETVIHYSLKTGSDVKITVHDLSGRLVRTLVDEPLKTGQHSVVWDGQSESNRKLPQGVYLYKIETGELINTYKMVMMK
jgi:hypothetical protein